MSGIPSGPARLFLIRALPAEGYTLSLHDALPISSSSSTRSRPSRRRPRSRARWATSCRACRRASRSEEHTSELQSRRDLVCRLLLEKKKMHLLAGKLALLLVAPFLTCLDAVNNLP